MKTKILIIIEVVILLVISVFILKGIFANTVVDKTGMVRSPEDEIVLCRYSSGGGMDGLWESLEIRESKNAVAIIFYEYSSMTSDKNFSQRVEVSVDVLNEIRSICKKYSIFSWGELKDSDELLLDAPVTTVYVSTGDISYSYNSNQEIPKYAYGITTELYDVMHNYLKGVD